MKEENGTRLSEFGLGVILRFFLFDGRCRGEGSRRIDRDKVGDHPRRREPRETI